MLLRSCASVVRTDSYHFTLCSVDTYIMDIYIQAEFPEITVCVEGGGYKEDVFYQHGFNTAGDYRSIIS